jgi:hypothetical protein
MNYLVCMLLIGIVIAGFMYVLAKMERGHFPSEQTTSIEAVLKELLLGRRTS